MITYRGIDTSSCQSISNLESIKKAMNLDFIIAKAGNGNDGIDPTFHSTITQAQNAGLAYMAYNFIYPIPTATNPSRAPAAQAQAHFTACQGMPVACDYEWPAPEDFAKWNVTPSFMNEWVLEYLAAYEQLSGVRPCLYIYPYFASVLQPIPAAFANYKLWIASYGTATPPIPAPWTSYSMWQTGQGKLPSGAPVDLDVCIDPSVFGNQLVSAPVASTTAPAPVSVLQPLPSPIVPSDPVSVPANPIPVALPPASPSIWETIGKLISQFFGKL